VKPAAMFSGIIISSVQAVV